jgi:hypothetical protein
VGTPFYIRHKENDIVKINDNMSEDWANDPLDNIETAELVKDFFGAKGVI